MALPSIDIIIPVLNEEKTLAAQVAIIIAFLPQLDNMVSRANLVITDNGSTDRTGDIAKELTQKYPNVSYIRLDRKGVGLALKTAWSQSAADYVGYMDLDLATDLLHLIEAVKALSTGADIIYASRLHKNSHVIGRKPLRTVTSIGFNTICKIYLGTHFSDGMCGFKFLQHRHLATLMANGAVSDGWFFSTELLAVGEWLGLKLRELPVTWRDDPDSRVQIIPLTIAYLKAMKALRGKKQFIKKAA